MAQDLFLPLSAATTATVECVPDDVLYKYLSTSVSSSDDSSDGSTIKIDLLLVGSDCILPNGDSVNKVGTTKLCKMAKKHGVPVYCSVDRWKVWDDCFLPPMEEHLFEVVPLVYIDRVLVPPRT